MKRHSKRHAFCCMKGGGIFIAEDHAARKLVFLSMLGPGCVGELLQGGVTCPRTADW